MARQFKSTDTSIWTEQFGNGKDGALTISSSAVFEVAISPFTTNANAFGTFTGTLGATSGTVTDGYGFWTSYVVTGDIVLIHQTYGTGAGNWELNVVTGGIPTSGGSSTLTLKYPLQNTYGTGTQIVKVPQFTSFTLNNSIITYPPVYNDSYGGILAFFCNGTTTISGTIYGDGRGFAGGGVPGNTTGYQGKSSTSVTVSNSTSANGAGGGGGAWGNGASAGGGGGGGNGTSGANGLPGSRGAGIGGSTDGNTSLTDFNFGGGGGSGGWRDGQNGSPGSGGNGGAGIFIFTKNLVINGAISNIGSNGNAKSGTGSHGAGGGGAGGSVLIKSITATLGTNLVVANGGTGGVNGGSSNDGGNGGTGRIHLDYAGSYTGTTTPTLDVSQDSSLYPSGGSFLYNLL